VLTGSGGLGADPTASRWQGLAAVAALVAAGLLSLRRSGRRRMFPLVTALLTALALAPAAWGLAGPTTKAGSVPPAVAAVRAPIARADLAPPAGATAAVAIAVHSARAADLPTMRTDAAPSRIRIPALVVSGAIVPVGVEVGTGRVEIPDDVRTVGWYRFGPRPGDAGSSVLVGHVASVDQGAGLFYHLRDLPPGARIEVAYADGTTRAFVVRARREYPKGELPGDLFAREGSARLVLVTCGGPYDAATGHYRDNVVLYAVPRSGA
jgi:sortase (surface protein transpeptidase)